MNSTSSVLRLSVVYLLTAVIGGLAFAQTNTFPSTGNAGIGTTNPAASLDIWKYYSAGSDSLRFSFNDGTAYWMGIQPYVVGAGNVGYKFRTNNGTSTVEALAITGDGRVGIGTTSPGALLDVAGSVAVGTVTNGTNISLRSYSDGRAWNIRDDAGVNRLRFARGSSDQVFWDVLKTAGSDAVAGQIWYANGAERIRLDSAGNVGIGMNNPAYRLHIADSSNQVSFGLGEAMSSSAALTGYRVATWNDSNVYVDAKVGTGGSIIYRYGEGAQSGSANTWMVHKGGNVGIGTVNPTSKLDIHTDGSSGAQQLRLTDTGASGRVWSLASRSAGAFQISDESGGTIVLTARSSGNVGIGTTSPSHKLAVNGTIKAKEVIVETTGWSDYVFADDYRLAPLAEVEAHIREKKHLPGIPSAAEVEHGGVSLGDMQARLLAKVEELTLHAIEQEKRYLAQEKRNDAQQAEITALRAELARLSIPN